MLNFLLTRAASALLVMLGVACLTFALIHIVPGDPVEVMLGESASAADRDTLRTQLGLDQPWPAQLRDYLLGLVRGDLGQSLHERRGVADMILARLPATAELAVAGLAVAVALALPLGIVGALQRGRAADSAAMTVSLLGVSIPNFVLGPLLVLVFAFHLGWVPVSGRGGTGDIVLPALTLGTALAAILARMLRATLLETLHDDYVRTARAKGLGPLAVVLRHVLPNAALPLITLLGLQLGALLGGAVITEIVFSWPGVGQLAVESIQKRDYPVLQGCVLLVSFVYVFVNTFTDLVYGWLDPRIRIAG